VTVSTALRSRVVHPLPPLAGLLSLEVGGLVLPMGVAIFATFATGATVTSAGLLWWTACSMNEGDQARRQSDRAVRRS
jgi:hypothetical protein